MSTNVAENINIFGYSPDALATMNKFMATVPLYSNKDAKFILNYLESFGIVSFRPSNQKLFCMPLNTIKQRVDNMSRLQQLDAYREDPVRIMSKDAHMRVAFCILKNIPYKKVKEDGRVKYDPILFDKVEFERKYGIDYLTLNFDSFVKLYFPNVDEVETFAPIEELPDDGELFKKYLSEEYDDYVYEEPVAPTVEQNPIYLILENKQSEPLEDIDRYGELYEMTRSVMRDFRGSDNVSERVASDIVKLINSEITDDATVIYYAIAHGDGVDVNELSNLGAIVSDVVNVNYNQSNNQEEGMGAR